MIGLNTWLEIAVVEPFANPLHKIHAAFAFRQAILLKVLIRYTPNTYRLLPQQFAGWIKLV